MARGTLIQARFDDELLTLLERHAARRRINLSAALRDVVRYGLGMISKDSDAGWREGYVMATQRVREIMHAAINEMDGEDPRAVQPPKPGRR